MRFLLITFALAASIAASDFTIKVRRQKPSEGKGQPIEGKPEETKIQMGDRATNWGITYPWEVMQKFTEDSSPCKETSCEGEIKDVKTYVANKYEHRVDGVGFGYRELKIKVTSNGFYYDKTQRDAMIGAVMKSLEETADRRPTDWIEKKGKGAPEIKHTHHENWATNYIDVAMYAKIEGKPLMMAFMEFDIVVEELNVDPESFCDFGSTAAGVGGGIAAGLSAGFPPFAIVAGFFGIIGATCGLGG